MCVGGGGGGKENRGRRSWWRGGTLGTMVGSLVGWLNLLNPESSPKRFWRGPRSQEVGEEGDYLTLHCHYQSDSCIQMGSGGSHFNVSLTVRGKATKTVSTNHNF